MMQVADESMMRMAEASYFGRDVQEGRLAVQFRLNPVRDDVESEKQGRPIFKDVEFIKIVVPGDKDNVIDREVYPADRERFRVQYTAWKTNVKETAVDGTPLEEWTLITRSQVEELKHFNVRTVEQLASVSDGNLKNVGPYQSLKQKAKDFVDKAKGEAPVVKMRSELEAVKSENETLKRQIKELGDRFEQERKQNSSNQSGRKS